MEFAALSKQQAKAAWLYRSSRAARTGFGVGSTTFSMACGRAAACGPTSASACRDVYRGHVDPLALNMLAQGYAPAVHIVRMLAATIWFGLPFGIMTANNVVACRAGLQQMGRHTVGPH